LRSLQIAHRVSLRGAIAHVCAEVAPPSPEPGTAPAASTGLAALPPLPPPPAPLARAQSVIDLTFDSDDDAGVVAAPAPALASPLPLPPPSLNAAPGPPGPGSIAALRRPSASMVVDSDGKAVGCLSLRKIAVCAKLLRRRMPSAPLVVFEKPLAAVLFELLQRVHDSASPLTPFPLPRHPCPLR
jgi:hypothetical protein